MALSAPLFSFTGFWPPWLPPTKKAEFRDGLFCVPPGVVIYVPHLLFAAFDGTELESNRADDQLSSLDLVAESEQQANTLVGLLNRLVVQCQDERTVSTVGYHSRQAHVQLD